MNIKHWIGLAKDRDFWRALMNVPLKLVRELVNEILNKWKESDFIVIIC